MSNNPNFNNSDRRPIFNQVYDGDENLCYVHEKSRALLGYFATSPYAEEVSFDKGFVVLKFNDKRITILVDSFFKHITIGESDELGNLKGSFYSYDFYLRHTIDYLIIKATELITKELEIDTPYKLWKKA